MLADFTDYRRVLLWVNLRISAGEKIMPADFVDYRRVLLWVNLRISAESAGLKNNTRGFRGLAQSFFTSSICEYLRNLREQKIVPADFVDYRRVFYELHLRISARSAYSCGICRSKK